MDHALPRGKQAVDHVGVVIHAQLDILHDAEYREIILNFLVGIADVMLAPLIEALDLLTETRYLTSEMGEHHVLGRDAETIDVQITVICVDAIRL
jgi:hypothetical protein